MAQLPWTPCSSQPLSCTETKELLHKCQADILKHLCSTDSVSLAMSQISEALAEYAIGNRFFKVTAKGTVQLHPCYLNKIRVGVRWYLSNFLLRFVPEFNGIWLGYDDFEILDSVGFTAQAEPWGFVVFDVRVNCVVFKPTIGCYVVGVVKQVRPTHIAVLVHGFFNANIQRNRIPPEFTYGKAKYKHTKGKADIEVNKLLKFRVIAYQYSDAAELLSIEGSLEQGAKTGVVDETGEFVIR